MSVSPVCLSQNNPVPVFQRDNGLLPIRGLSCLGSALATKFAEHVERVYFGHLYLEQILHRLKDLSFVGAWVGNDSVLIILLALPGALLGEANGLDYFESIHATPCLAWLRPVQKRLA